MKRALLLEDDPVAKIVAMKLLLAAGYAVSHVADVRRARVACAQKDFALFLIDATVRDGSGIDFATWLVSTHKKPRIVIWSATDRSTEAKQIGAMFVAKGDREALWRALK